MSTVDARKVHEAADALGVTVLQVLPITGDASRRSFYRVGTPSGSLVAAVYPDGAEAQVERDEAVHAWGFERSLPIPRPVGHTALVALSEDLGDEDLERALRARGDAVINLAFDTLAEFQACPWHDLVTPQFDAAFFRHELEVFEQYALGPGSGRPEAIAPFLDDLCVRIADHPFRLVHRDFHVNNLFLRGGSTVAAVDYQDMRGGPDTYDAASLLRERGGGELLGSDQEWRERAALRLGWQTGWERRYLECAAQRGLKVVGTFLRLASWGRTEYLAWLPRVRELTRRAIVALDGPGALAARL